MKLSAGLIFIAGIIASAANGAGALSPAPPAMNASSDDRAEKGPRIVVLNSYHPGYAWSDDEYRGLSEVLREKAPAARIRLEHLDLKRLIQPDYLDRMASLLEAKYRGLHPSLIITLDDPALDFLLQYRMRIFPGIPVVFGGVNDYYAGRTHGAPSITGVAEIFDVEGTLRLMLSLHPRTKEIVVLNDRSATGLGVQKATEAAAKLFPNTRFSAIDDRPLAEILALLGKKGPGSLIFVGSYARDHEGHTYNTDEIADLVSRHSSVPFYALHEGRLGHGIVGGRLISGITHGRMVADQALRVIRGEPASSIPVNLASSTKCLMDARQLRRFVIPEKLVPRDCEIRFASASFYSLHPFVAWILAVTFILFAATVFGLLYFIRMIHRGHAAVRESERALRDIFRETSAAITLSRLEDGKLVEINPSFERSLGVSRQEAIGHTLRELDVCRLDTARGLLIESAKRPLENRTPIEIPFESRRGETLTGLASPALIRVKGQEYLLTLTQWVNEYKRIEEKLWQAQKMEAIGNLAGGLAHDFNNIMSVIVGLAETINDQLDRNHPMRPHVDTILRTGERASGLIRQLMIFSRKQVIQPTQVGMNSVILETHEILKRLLGEDIRFSLELEPALRPVLADRVQIEQILLNLAINSRDAMINGGTLVIRSKNVIAGEPKCPHSLLSVTDNGCGMSEEVKARVFEPFFTTKEVGKGTGMGLSTIHGIVKQCGGFVEVESEPDAGATFRIYLPSVQESEQRPQKTEAAARPAGNDEPGARNETLLLVEDEDDVRSLLREMLTRAGYRVIDAARPQEAIDSCKEHQGSLDLLITDFVMPEMSGAKLSQMIRDLRPGIKVLYISGYLDPSRNPDAVFAAGAYRLQKPFRRMQLIKKVREILDAPHL